jgi:hypothetical protein
MGKLKFMILKEKHVDVITDALRAYVALRTEEYHQKPSVKGAEKMSDAVETLDLFICPKKPKSEVQRRVERAEKK